MLKPGAPRHVVRGMRSLPALRASARLAPLAAVVAIAGACARHRGPADDPTLARLFAEDQGDRRATPDAEWRRVDARDATRRRVVDSLLAAGRVRTAADHYHAAMVLHHADDTTSARRAHALAARADTLGSRPARWLAAASLDRLRLRTGAPQLYGTQFLEGPDGRLYLEPMDTLAVSDAERTRVGARTLAATRAWLAARNGVAEWSLAARPPAPPAPPAHAKGPRVELVGELAALTRALRLAAPIPDGAVRVQLLVAVDGTVAEAFVVDGVRPDADAEVLRVVRAARFVNRAGEPWEIRLRVPLRAAP